MMKGSRPRFSRRLNKVFRAVGDNQTATWILQGVCQTDAELVAMKSQANNGHRIFHAVLRDGWIGLYIAYKGE